jgi:hypothetical protein
MKEETRKEPTQYALRMEKRRLASAARVQDLLDKADKAQQERKEASLQRQREKAAIERELAKITEPADKAQFAVHKKASAASDRQKQGREGRRRVDRPRCKTLRTDGKERPRDGNVGQIQGQQRTRSPHRGKNRRGAGDAGRITVEEVDTKKPLQPEKTGGAPLYQLPNFP